MSGAAAETSHDDAPRSAPLFPTWCLAGAGVLVAIASAACGLAAEVLDGPPYTHAAAPYWNATVRLGSFLLFALLTAHVRGLLRAVHELAATDPLTGVWNARQFYRLAAAEVERAGGTAGR